MNTQKITVFYIHSQGGLGSEKVKKHYWRLIFDLAIVTALKQPTGHHAKSVVVGSLHIILPSFSSRLRKSG